MSVEESSPLWAVSFIERAGIIRYNEVSIAVTNKHVRSFNVWKPNIA